MASITAIILTRNEEDFIEECINSIKEVVERIVVVDSYSDDNTVTIAEKLGAEVYQHEFFNYAKQYMYAVEIAQVKTKWILRIDADERLTPGSAAELEKLCNENETTDVTGIVLRFYNMFLGKPMLHGGMYPWKKLSVYKTGKGNIEDRNMDEHIILDSGRTIETKIDSKHLAFRGLTFFTNKCNWYSSREVMDYFEQKSVSLKNADFKTRLKMKVYYKLPLGFRAWHWYRFLVDAKIYEHEKMGTEFKPTGALK